MEQRKPAIYKPAIRIRWQLRRLSWDIWNHFMKLRDQEYIRRQLENRNWCGYAIAEAAYWSKWKRKNHSKKSVIEYYDEVAV